MRRDVTHARRLSKKNADGPTTTEYAIIFALILAALVSAVRLLSGSLRGLYVFLVGGRG